MDVESPSTELSKLGAEALRDLYNNLAGVKSFALEQAPDVCQQMIQWEIACGCIAAFAFAALATTMFFAAPRAARIEAESTGDAVGTVILSVCILAPSSIIAVFCVVSAIKAYVAPKLFLLEKIAATLKGLS